MIPQYLFEWRGWAEHDNVMPFAIQHTSHLLTSHTNLVRTFGSQGKCNVTKKIFYTSLATGCKCYSALVTVRSPPPSVFVLHASVSVHPPLLLATLHGDEVRRHVLPPGLPAAQGPSLLRQRYKHLLAVSSPLGRGVCVEVVF